MEVELKPAAEGKSYVLDLDEGETLLVLEGLLALKKVIKEAEADDKIDESFKADLKLDLDEVTNMCDVLGEKIGDSPDLKLLD